MLASARKEDTVARMGGDEFAVLCTKIDDAEEAVVKAKRIMDVLSMPVHVCRSVCSIGASIGIGLYPQDGESGEMPLSRADAAMYRVKEGGKWGSFIAI